jgi:ferritin
MSNQELAQQAKSNQSSMQYFTNPAKRRKIDFILEECASLFANCDSTYEARQQAKYKEQELLAEIAKLDLHFAIQCGYLQQDN